MKICSLFIVRPFGIPIYWRNFTEDLKNMDFSLASSFLTAMLDFSKEVIKKELNVLEMGDLRFFFQNYKEKGFPELIVILITDITTSVLLIRERMNLICQGFFSNIDPDECQNQNGAIIENKNLDTLMDSLINLGDDYSTVKIDILKQIFENEISNGDISAGAIISLKGQIYYSSLPSEDLHTALKEIEIRSQSQTNTDADLMPKTIFQSGNKMIFSQVVVLKALQKDPVNIVLLFAAGITLGMADFGLEDIIKKLSSLTLNSDI